MVQITHLEVEIDGSVRSFGPCRDLELEAQHIYTSAEISVRTYGPGRYYYVPDRGVNVSGSYFWWSGGGSITDARPTCVGCTNVLLAPANPARRDGPALGSAFGILVSMVGG